MKAKKERIQPPKTVKRAVKTAAPGTGKREKSIRWTLNKAAREFGIHREQLERRRRALGIEPGEDRCFTSRDVARMMFGDKEDATIGKIAAERARIERENREADGELVPVERVAILGERYVAAVRQVILNSGLSDAEKTEALGEIVQLGETDWTAEAKSEAAK